MKLLWGGSGATSLPGPRGQGVAPAPGLAQRMEKPVAEAAAFTEQG